MQRGDQSAEDARRLDMSVSSIKGTQIGPRTEAIEGNGANDVRMQEQTEAQLKRIQELLKEKELIIQERDTYLKDIARLEQELEATKQLEDQDRQIQMIKRERDVFAEQVTKFQAEATNNVALTNKLEQKNKSLEDAQEELFDTKQEMTKHSNTIEALRSATIVRYQSGRLDRSAKRFLTG